MTQHRYILEPYKGMCSRHVCPSCNKPKKFARYIDTETNEQLGNGVGRCDREDSCSYHYTPKQYFADNGITPPTSLQLSSEIKQELPPTIINPLMVEKSLSGYNHNNFITYLKSLFPEELVNEAIRKYKIGTSKHWPGSTIFWQIDEHNNTMAGKIMQYNAETGKRVKEPTDRITWAHVLLKLKDKPDFNLKQCFFGQHLLLGNKGPIAIVESEKTAIIASIYLSEFTWLACGNKTGLSLSKCEHLKGRSVVLYPDLNAFDTWKKRGDAFNFKTSSLLEDKSTDEERRDGLDLADFLVKLPIEDFSTITTRVKEIDNSPILLALHAKFTAAHKSGKLHEHPLANHINTLWQGVKLYRNQPSSQQHYIELLQAIAI